MNMLKSIWWACSAGGVLFVCGCSQPTAAQSNQPATGAGTARNRVTALPPVRKTLQRQTVQPCLVEAFEETPLYAKIPGYVSEVLVDIGDVVAHDQPLVRLRVPELNDELQQKEALLAQAEAEVRQAEAAVQAAAAAVASAEAKVQLARAGTLRTDAEYNRWKAEHARISTLAQERAVTQKLVDETLNQFRAAEAARDETEAQIASAKALLLEAQADLGKAQADKGAAEARRKVAEANVGMTRTMRSYTEIRAPYAGVVTRRNVDTGHFVQAGLAGGARPLLVVTRTDLVRVFVDVPEVEAPLVDGGEQGDPGTIHVQALEGREFTARVRRTSWALDPTNRSLRAELDIPNPDGALRPGMFATVSILLQVREDVLTLPITAIGNDADGTYCLAVDSGRLVRRPIRVGLRVEDEIEVLEGVTAEQLIVQNRTESLAPGQEVEVLAPQGK